MDYETLADYVAGMGYTVTVAQDHGWQFLDGWKHHAYTVVISNPHTDYVLTTPWRQGEKVTKRPEDSAVDILENLISGNADLPNTGDFEADFEAWCDECGYDSDSREREATFRRLQELAPQIAALIGPDDLGDVEELVAMQ